MNKAQKKLFASRPKTMKAVVAALAKVGARLAGLRLDTNSNSHDAPLGEATNFHNPTRLPAFVALVEGQYTSEGFAAGHPWDNLWWFHSGSGGAGRGAEYQYEARVYAADMPEVAAEWAKVHACTADAQNSLTAIHNRIRSAEQEAASRARDEATKTEAANTEAAQSEMRKARSKIAAYLADAGLSS